VNDKLIDLSQRVARTAGVAAFVWAFNAVLFYVNALILANDRNALCFALVGVAFVSAWLSRFHYARRVAARILLSYFKD
jgi:hypothetical protein